MYALQIQELQAVSAFFAFIRSPCLRHCVHGASIGVGGDLRRRGQGRLHGLLHRPGQPKRGGGCAVSAPFPSWHRSILTEIYLCHPCSYHEIEDGNAWAGLEWWGAPGVLNCYVRAPGA
eukprot:COSAG01_NODE_24547_length_775_cov_0.991124_1_plen_118_part_10